LNLIRNTIKFTDKGEIRVTAHHDREQAKMAFVFSDTGIGIAPEQLPFLFDKFWQVDAARTRTQSGIGMGLYIVRAFTEMLGGSVSVNSTVGKDAEFKVEFRPVKDGSRKKDGLQEITHWRFLPIGRE
jgi:signal transduction histidine kinase